MKNIFNEILTMRTSYLQLKKYNKKIHEVALSFINNIKIITRSNFREIQLI